MSDTRLNGSDFDDDYDDIPTRVHVRMLQRRMDAFDSEVRAEVKGMGSKLTTLETTISTAIATVRTGVVIIGGVVAIVGTLIGIVLALRGLK